jgi:hypothetical protein
MADKKQMDTSKIDALYSWISYDLQKMKSELMGEMKYSSVQLGSLYQEIKNDKDKSSQAISQEIRYSYKQNQTIYDGLARMLTEEVGARLNAMDEKVGALEQTQKTIKDVVAEVIAKLDEVQESVSTSVKAHVDEALPALEEAVGEIKYSYVQQQAIYDGLTTLIQSEVIARLDDASAKLSMLEQIDGALNALQEKLAELEANDFKVTMEECVGEHSRHVLEAVNAIPVAENVDYNRIVDEVGDKVLDLLGEIILPTEKDPEELIAKVDYDKIAYGTAEKVVESLPYPEKVNYRRIDEAFIKAAEKVQVQVSEETLNAAVTSAVEKAFEALDMDALAQKIADKLQIPVPQAPAIDYDLLAEKVAEKIQLPTAAETDYDRIQTIVASTVVPVEVPETDYERIAKIVEEKLNEKENKQPTYEFVVDEEGVQAIAKGVARELCTVCTNCQDAPVEETVETVEEPAQETVEELAVAEEIAVVEEPQLVDVSDSLVERLNRSFTAKMKQSADKVKKYYSDIKNALTSYDRLNSNVSWNGDRFNFGRNTVAKMLIRGKTLCLLLALDPEAEDLPIATYHQKNVGDQKAHEDTPFMVKITSDLASRKAVRLVNVLAEKLEAKKAENFAPVDYVQEYSYESDEKLMEAGYIKKSLEKKVDFNF